MINRHRGLTRAGALIVGAGLLLGAGLALGSCSRIEPLHAVDGPDETVDLVEFIDVELRVFDLEAQAAGTADALDALKPLGPRVAAVEARTQAVEARLDEIAARSAPPPVAAASVPRRPVRRASVKAPPRPLCPFVAAALSTVRPGP